MSLERSGNIRSWINLVFTVLILPFLGLAWHDLKLQFDQQRMMILHDVEVRFIAEQQRAEERFVVKSALAIEQASIKGETIANTLAIKHLSEGIQSLRDGQHETTWQLKALSESINAASPNPKTKP